MRVNVCRVLTSRRADRADVCACGASPDFPGDRHRGGGRIADASAAPSGAERPRDGRGVRPRQPAMISTKASDEREGGRCRTFYGTDRAYRKSKKERLPRIAEFSRTLTIAAFAAGLSSAAGPAAGDGSPGTCWDAAPEMTQTGIDFELTESTQLPAPPHGKPGRL